MRSFISKNWLVILGILIVIILVHVLLTKLSDNESLRKALLEKSQEIKIINDNNIQLKERQVSYELSKVLYEKEKDSLAKLLKIKPKVVKEYTSVTSEIDTTLKLKTDTFINPSTKVIDSIGLSFKDLWISIDGKVTPKGSELSIQGKDSLLITRYKKGRDLIVDIRNTNKYIHLTGASSLTITPEKEKVLKVSPFIGVGYDPFDAKFHPVIGVGITVNIKGIFKK